MIVAILGATTTIGLVVFSVITERYLEAVAASCIVPVLTWFALGLGKSEK